MKGSSAYSPISDNRVPRRRFLRDSSLAAAGAVVAAEFPFVVTNHAAADEPIRIGLIGCGGRGTGAAFDALTAASNVKVVALADAIEERLKLCRFALGTKGETVADDHCFVGFDAYQKLLALPEVNYVIHATPPGFRPMHLRAAVEAGKHVFIEKPAGVDAPGVRSVMASGEMAARKNLSIVVGTQRRHQNNYRQAIRRLQDGAVGEILAARAYANLQGDGQPARPPNFTDMEWQLRLWHYYVWLSGDHIVEQHTDNLDVINWILNAHPIKASGMGGRQVRTLGHIYDHFATEFEYPNGARLFSYCRQINGCHDSFSESVIGTQGTSDCFQTIQVKGKPSWRFEKLTTVYKAGRGDGGTNNSYVQEHADLIQSIRTAQPINEAKQIAESTLTAIMGRLAAYTGQSVDWDTAYNSQLDLMPAKCELGELPTPPVPVPGLYRFS